MAETEKTSQERFQDEVAKISQGPTREMLVEDIAALNRTGEESYWGQSAIALGLLYVGDMLGMLVDTVRGLHDLKGPR